MRWDYKDTTNYLYSNFCAEKLGELTKKALAGYDSARETVSVELFRGERREVVMSADEFPQTQGYSGRSRE